MLEENRRRVQNLSGTELWLFIISRVLGCLRLGHPVNDVPAERIRRWCYTRHRDWDRSALDCVTLA